MTTELRSDLYPELRLSDEMLLKELFAALTKSVDKLADPYSEDGSYVAAINRLPIGLRSMAATHHLDISLTMDDIGWHFLNFGEPGLVRATEEGLRELGLPDMADWFNEAFGIVNPLKPKISAADEYYDVLTQSGKMERIDELTDLASDKEPKVSGSPIYSAWVSYTRKYPERVFGKRCTA